MSVLRLTTMAVLLSVGMHVSAEDIRPELDKCRSIESLAYRLQCYDQLVDGLHQSGLSTVVPDAPAPSVGPQIPQSTQQVSSAPGAPSTSVAVTASSKSKQETAEDLFGKSGDEVKKVVARELEVDSVDRIESEVTQVRIAPNQEYVVYLANGQVWRQKDKIGKWRIKVGERALISKAALGSYMMKSDQRKRSVRAERIR